VFRPSTHIFYLRNGTISWTTTAINWGVSTDKPVTGKWQTTSSVSDNTIRIKNFAFDPASITVKVGSTVRWVNQDYAPHRILFADGADSTVLAASQSWNRKFDQAGTYDYNCTIHPSMQGSVIVK
jgi:plastocyanin